ncbi:MAG: hypothetical protein AAFV95_12505 [Bacteroidota bacterium]
MKSTKIICCWLLAALPIFLTAQDDLPLRPEGTHYFLNFAPLGLGLEVPVGKKGTINARGNMTFDFDSRIINEESETFYRVGSRIDVSYRQHFKGPFRKLQENRGYKGKFYDYFGAFARIRPPAFYDNFEERQGLRANIGPIVGTTYRFANRLYLDANIGPSVSLRRGSVGLGWMAVSMTFGIQLN